MKANLDAESAASTTPTEATFAAVVDSMFDTLVILRAIRDVDGAVVDFRFDYLNAASKEHLGWEPTELVGSTVLQILPQLTEYDLFGSLIQVVETGARVGIVVDQFAGVRTSGSFELRARRLDDSVVLTIRNVTERRELERLVEQSETHLRQVVDALPVGVGVVDREGVATYLNDEGRRILAVDRPGPVATEQIPELVGLRREFTGELYPAEELGLARALRTGAPVSVDDIVVDRNGQTIPLETHAMPLFAADGSISGAVNVFEDVSQRRAQQAMLARALAELTAVNEQLGEFAAVAAHDLGSPLRAISGFAALLAERYGASLERDAREWIEFIQADAARMRILIDDLLAYARAGAGPPPTSTVELTEVVAEVAEILHSALGDRGARLEVAPLPMVAGDRSALFVVFRNLLGNALKFLREDTPGVIRVGVEQRQDEWVVAVADNGVGVPDGEREQLFVPFQRGEASANRGGNGLGLSICRRIVEYHGGRIWYDPTPGGGATFRFTLAAA